MQPLLKVRNDESLVKKKVEEGLWLEEVAKPKSHPTMSSSR